MATRVRTLVLKKRTEPLQDTKTQDTKTQEIPETKDTKTPDTKETKTIEGRYMSFNGSLYPFQHNVFNWAIDAGKGIIALDMGLGKTVTTIAILCAGSYQHIMIVVPLALMNQWKESFHKFTNVPHKDIYLYQGRYRKNVDLKKYRVVLTTYDVIRTDMSDGSSPLYRAIGLFDCAVLDEAHKIRNKKTQLYLACRDLFASTNAKWLLSGTVIHNQFSDFTTLMEFLDISQFDPTQIKSQDNITYWKSKYYYRLTKAQCDLGLPQKNITQHNMTFDEDHIDVYVDVFAEVREMYDQYLRMPTRINYNNLLSKILRLRQCCNHPDAMLSQQQYNIEINRHKSPTSAKFTKIAQIIANMPRDDKILIFSQWDHSLDILARYLKTIGHNCLEYNGQMSLDNKNAVLQNFKTGSTQVLLITISSGGVGLDLSFANHVVIMDSWWNHALEEQAIDRVYRIGQKKNVFIHRLYMQDTIEEWLIEMKRQKSMVAQKFDDEHAFYQADKEVLSQLLAQHI